MTKQTSENRYRWLLLFSISMMAFVTNGDYLAVNFSLVQITSELHTTINIAQWILSGYMLAWATLVIPSGKLLDKYDPKHICILGIGIFLLASTMAGLASSIGMLIAARLLQGIGGAVFLPTIYSMIYSHFDEKERGKAMGLIGLAVGVGLALGPVIGGFLVTWANWQSIFFVNIPIGIVAMTIIYAGKGRAPQSNVTDPISRSSILLLSLISISTLFTLSNWPEWSSNPLLYIFYATGIMTALIVFLKIQQYIHNPLIPSELFKNHAYWGCCLGILLVEFSFSSVMVIVGLYLQNILHLTSLMSGNIFLSMSIVFGVIAAMGGSWVDKKGLAGPTLLGLSITAFGALFFSLFASTFNLWIISSLFMMMGIGLGLSFTGLNTGIVKTVPQKYLGIASSIFLMITLLGNALGVTIATMIYESFSLNKLLTYMEKLGYNFNFSEKKQLAIHIGNMSGTSNTLETFTSTIQNDVFSNMVPSLNAGIKSAMMINFLLSVCIIIFCSILFNRKTTLNGENNG